MANEDVELVEGGLFTVAEGQEFSRLSRSALYSLMECGRLPFVKIGKRRLIPKRALVELARQGLVVRDPAMA
jgi:excisionase family DNA binding protein